MKFSFSLSFLLAGVATSVNAYVFDWEHYEQWKCEGGWSRHHTKLSSGVRSSTVSVPATSRVNPPSTSQNAPAPVTSSNLPSAPTSVAAPPPSPVTSKASVTTVRISTTSLSSAAAPSSTNGAVTTTLKRGLGFNDIGATTPFGSKVGWAYNWDSQHQGKLVDGVEFVPMLWSDNNDHVPQWATNAQKAIDAGAKHLLAFNEPDLSSQANMSPQQAATSYMKHMQPFAGKAKLVSPAITNGGPPMGVTWLDNFLSECTKLGCTIDAIAIHIYDSASNTAYFQAYISDVVKKYGKPVWVTEFGASGSVADQQKFLQTMVPFLENLQGVERYSYFGDFEGTFVSKGSLLPLGQTFATAQ